MRSLTAIFILSVAASCLPPPTDPEDQAYTVVPAKPCDRTDGPPAALEAPETYLLPRTTVVLERDPDVTDVAVDAFVDTVAQIDAFAAGTLAVPPFLRIRLCADAEAVSVAELSPVPMIHLADRLGGRKNHVTRPVSLAAQAFGRAIFALNGLVVSDGWAQFAGPAFRTAELSNLEQQLEAARTDWDSGEHSVDEVLDALAREKQQLARATEQSPYHQRYSSYAELFADALAVFVLEDGESIARELEYSAMPDAAAAQGLAAVADEFYKATVDFRDFTRLHTVHSRQRPTDVATCTYRVRRSDTQLSLAVV